MAENNDANKDAKKSGLGRKFAIAAGALVMAGGIAVGGAIAVNGVDRRDVTSADGSAHLKTMTIKPVFEKQSFDTPGAHYWCFSAASIKCPIPISEQDKPAYDALKNAPKP